MEQSIRMTEDRVEHEANVGADPGRFRRDPCSSEVRFAKKGKNCSQNYRVLRLEAVITPQ